MRYAVMLDGEYVKVTDDRFEHTGLYVLHGAR